MVRLIVKKYGYDVRLNNLINAIEDFHKAFNNYALDNLDEDGEMMRYYNKMIKVSNEQGYYIKGTLEPYGR